MRVILHVNSITHGGGYAGVHVVIFTVPLQQTCRDCDIENSSTRASRDGAA